MRRLLFSLAVLAGCTKSGPAQESPPVTNPEPAVAPVTKPPAAPAAKTGSVDLLSVTLADDCGGTPPWQAPAPAAPAAPAAPGPAAKRSTSPADQAPRASMAKRRCEQTSMQLSVVAGDAASISVKSVELFDDAGTSIGKLTASHPTRWDEATSAYAAWDEKLPAGATSSVSYALSRPNWDSIGDRWNKTYTLKTVVSVGGVDASAEKTVTLTAPTALPPNVKT